MLSPLALTVIDELESKGLRPSPRDVIRLNALGLKLEAARAKNQVNSTFFLPRLARLSDTVSFRQPTIGHDIWFDRIERLVDNRDSQTVIAVKAFGLSRPAADLPDPDDPASVKLAIDTFCKECRDFTRAQLVAALDYVINGADERDGEFPARREREPDGSEIRDWDHCFSLGVLCKGHEVLWGMSAADMKALTRRQLRDMIEESYTYHNLRSSEDASDADAEFYATADEIEKRLTNDGKQSPDL